MAGSGSDEGLAGETLDATDDHAVGKPRGEMIAHGDVVHAGDRSSIVTGGEVGVTAAKDAAGVEDEQSGPL